MFIKPRKLIKLPLIQNIISWILYRYLWIVYNTSTWKLIDQHKLATFSEKTKPAIVAFFHGRLAMMPFAWKYNSPFFMLLSDHSDGHFIAKVIHHHGINSIYGSTTRGGAKAMMELLRKLKTNIVIGVTPDGPRGPNQSVSPGIIQISRLGNCPIVPSTYSVSNRVILKSWDRFMIPLPFSRGVMITGEPIDIPTLSESMSIEELQNHVQHIMIELQSKADNLLK